MEKKFQIQLNGQQVQVDDLNLLGKVAGLADDRVFAELFRITPFNGTTATKAILPHAHQTSGTTQTIAPNGATGSVQIHPFRAFVSSRTAEATEARDNWQDIRSGLSVAYGATDREIIKTLASNVSGNPRWDLVYAIVAVDADGDTVSRKQKDAVTKAITNQTVVLDKITGVTIGVQTGTPAASPVFPAAPADAAGVYYIPLAAVRVPTGFGSTSTVLATDIAMIAPILKMSGATGSATLEPSNGTYDTTGVVIGPTKQQVWGSSGNAPNIFIASSVVGKQELVFAVDLTTGTPSHIDGATIDDRDWRNRVCKWTISCDVSANKFAWEGDFASALIPDANQTKPGDWGTSQNMSGVGSSFSAGVSKPEAAILYLDNTMVANTGGGTWSIRLRADGPNGQLRIYYTGTPACKILFWLEFSGPLK